MGDLAADTELTSHDDGTFTRLLHRDWEIWAPSIDVSCEFHRLPSRPGWYFLRGVSPFAGDGLVASRQVVLDDGGSLLASGISHMLCRPVR